MINLTEKDADWIANIASEELKTLREAEEEVLAKVAELEKEANGILQKHPEWENAKEELEKAKAKSLEENKAFLEKETAKWQKIIELMIIGSGK